MFRFVVTSCRRTAKNGCDHRLLKQSRCRASTTEIKQQTAAPAKQEKPKLLEVFIDEKKVLVEPGTTILEAAAMAGVEIPRFCYHERLSVAGNCRMCLVEVEKSVKPVASCAMPIMMNGVKVKTDSPMTKQAREGVMEFLLMNHPLDCPICDQGGECDLQDQSMAFGSDRSRLQVTLDPKRAVEDKNIGPLVKTIMTRCIHCTRCVRFMNEVAGCDDLGTTGRGSDMQIGTYLENTALLSELSGNIVDLCPVGALTSKPYAFTARPWELRRVDSVDVFDAVGSNIVVCTRSGDLMRILPRENDAVNEEWLADKARHAPVDGLKNQRLTVPLIKPSKDSSLQICDWEDALLTVARALNVVHPNKMNAIVGPFVDAETMVVLKDLFNAIGSENLYVHVDSDLDPSCIPSSKDIDFRKNYLFNSTIAGLEEGVDLLLIVGSNPRFEAPILNARIRKAWRNNFINDIALIGEKDLDLKYDYEHLGDSVKTLSDIVSGKHNFADRLKKAKRAVVILGQQILKNGNDTKVYDMVHSLCNKFGAELNVLHANASQVAAFDLGYKPSSELKKDSSDDQSLLWLIGVDDPKLEIPNNCFVIYQGHTGDICANSADVVLPGCAYTEKQGTYVNIEGRVQQTMAAITPPNNAREDWKIVKACAEVSNNFIPYDTLLDLRERMKQIAPHLAKHNSRTIEKASLNAPVKTVSNEGSGVVAPRMKTLLDYWQTDAISRCSPTMSKCIVSVKKEMEKRSIKN